jgi:hypothetical protein
MGVTNDMPDPQAGISERPTIMLGFNKPEKFGQESKSSIETTG